MDQSERRWISAVLVLVVAAVIVALLWPPGSRGGRAGRGGPGGDGTGGEEEKGAGGGEGEGAGVEKEKNDKPGAGADMTGEAGQAEAVSIPELGLAVFVDAEGARIVSVREGGPADAAGLAAGDAMTAVDGAPAAGKTAEALAKALGGQVGTQVTVSVRGAGGDARQVTMTRTLAPRPEAKPETVKAPTPTEKAMWDMAAHAVRRMLKEPESARFPQPGVEGTEINLGETRCSVKGYVESSVPAGGRAVSRFRCALRKRTDKEMWSVESVEFLD